MRILVTGGSGSLGRDLVPALLGRGDQVVVLDRECGALRGHGSRLQLIEGSVEDRTAASRAVRGVDAVVHLAWSFADDLRTLIEQDLLGQQILLDLCRAEKVRRFVCASSAVVYGKPLHNPIGEEHPLRPLEARKPAYGLAKEFAEKLALLAGRSGGPPATVLRFWWAFGGEIGGRHLRDLLRTAASGEPLRVPAGSGGSFLSAQDLNQAVGLSLSHPAAPGAVFNLASAYVSWEEIARMVVEVTGSRAGVELVPASRWTGAPFLADAWELDDRLARERLGYRPLRDPAGLRDQLQASIARTWQALSGEAR
ncbi:MAG TPA: NAD(P)-dependent oxidoreductase [Myxococcales bacterium]|nr:NAD(P)-dependent oxidoreductase [Myxococcales bacterium]